MVSGQHTRPAHSREHSTTNRPFPSFSLLFPIPDYPVTVGRTSRDTTLQIGKETMLLCIVKAQMHLKKS